jgi:hypothetical protein
LNEIVIPLDMLSSIRGVKGHTVLAPWRKRWVNAVSVCLMDMSALEKKTCIIKDGFLK